LIELVLDRDNPDAFTMLVSQLGGLIYNTVRSFANDPMLSRIEDHESLANLALLKLHNAVRDFKYESSLSEKHNEGRFISLAKTYMRNILIDQQYSANLSIRKPDRTIVDIDANEDSRNEPCDRRSLDPMEICSCNEMIDKCLCELDETEAEVFKHLLMNYNVEGVARKMGIQISRVRYIIYTCIQPKVKAILSRG